uniref:Nucleotide exchange factor SIL1 n=1 Tax=Odontella aurita TaxID=265563 RepID=A0A6U6FC79_9STRA|mmetsp:Transcript_33975/g.101444  ORF Transcript_33975/g.101444 Transcript_33975/m.101444 type:complete len:648 (+) Transcript_33975:249-2192(+)
MTPQDRALRLGRRRRRSTPSTTRLFSAGVLLLLVALSCCTLPSLPGGASRAAVRLARAEEIVATDEWIEVGPNDTIPAGLHVRIDMTTGKKMVKTLDESEMTDFDKKRMGVPVTDVEVDADGTATVIEEEGAGAAAAWSSSGGSRGVALSASDSSSVSGAADGEGGKEEKKKGEGKDDYDYEMMHRTLSNLPADEMAKYGGLPELPAGLGTPRVTPEQREMFEGKMQEIWKQRQELLQEIQENNVADVAQVIMGRIRVIAEYMDDPVGKRNEIEDAAAAARDGSQGDGSAPDLDDDDDHPAFVNNVLESLEDLEYQLSDVDMARDFHTLGGWPLAVSLLSDSAHCPSSHPAGVDDDDDGADFNETAAALEAARHECLSELASSSSSTRALVDRIQSRAAWAVGTAVKNHDEFHNWALEDFSALLGMSGIAGGGSASDERARSSVTATSLLLADYLSDDPAAAALATPSRKSRRQKGLYALGALVRGNPAAQRHFLELDGPSILAESMDRSLEAGDARFASKVLALGHDLLTGAADPNAETAAGKEAGALIDALTSKPWCDAAVRLSASGPGISTQVREKALEAVTSLAGPCGYGEEERGSVVKSRVEWLGGGGEEDDYLDPAYRNDLVALADAALGAIDKGNEADAR